MAEEWESQGTHTGESGLGGVQVGSASICGLVLRHLKRVDQVGEGHHAQAEGVQVPRLQHHLALHQDERQHLGQGCGAGQHLQGQLHAKELQGEVQGEVAQGEPRLVGQGEDQERTIPATFSRKVMD